jgi:hypothetical protein
MVQTTKELEEQDIVNLGYPPAADLTDFNGFGTRLTALEAEENAAAVSAASSAATAVAAKETTETLKSEAQTARDLAIAAKDSAINAKNDTISGLAAKASQSSLDTLSAAVGANEATNTNFRNAQASTNSAVANAVEVLEAHIETPTTGLLARATSLEGRTSAVESGKASAASVAALDSEINAATTGLKARATSLEGRTTAVENGKASAASVAALDSEINAATTGLKARATSLEGRTTAVENGKASAASVAALDSEINAATTGLKARATSLEGRTTAVENGKASAASVAALDAEINAATTGLKARATSLEGRTTAVENGKASAASVAALDAEINTATTGLKARATSLEGRTTAVENGKASAASVAALDAEINAATTGLKARATSLEGRTSAVESGKANQSAVDALGATVGANEATNTNFRNAQATTNSANSNSISTLSASLALTGFPKGFADINAWSNVFNANTLGATPANIVNGSYVSTSKGKALQVANSQYYGSKYFEKIDPNGVYEFIFEYEIVTNSNTGFDPIAIFGAWVFDASGANIWAHWFNQDFTTTWTQGQGLRTLKTRRTGAQILAEYPNAVYMRAGFISNWRAVGTSNSVQNYYKVDLKNIADLANLEASVTTAQAAIASNEGAAAFYNLEVAATGSAPALMSAKAGKTGSSFDFISKVFRIWNQTSTGVIEVLKAVGGYVFFSNPISIDVGARRLTLGANAAHVLWFGANTLAPPDQTIANSIFALGSDGKVYYGASELSGGISATQDKASVSAETSATIADYISTDTVAFTPSGGTSPYSYTHSILWHQGAGYSGLILNSNTASATGLTATINPYGSVIGQISTKIRDANGKMTERITGFGLSSTL